MDTLNANAAEHSQFTAELSWFTGSPNEPGVIPDELAHRVPDVSFTMYEWRDYHLTIPGAIALRIGNLTLHPVGQSDTFIVNIANRLGTAAITPVYPDSVGQTIHAEVLASKFPTLQDSLDFSQTIVDQLSARIRAMPFVVRAETSRQIVRDQGVPNLFFTFHYLRHHGEALVRALSVITHDPHRKLGDVVENLRIHQARRIDAEALHSLLTGPRAGKPNRAPGTSALERLQPLRITQRRPEETYNTPENRFVVAACRRLHSLIEQIRARHWWRDATDSDRQMLTAVDRALRILLLSDRFRGLESSLRIPAYSRVLQRKPGYRELTIFWSGLTQVHVPELVRLSEAVDLRDVPTLYEYWQFFEISEAIGRHTDMEPEIDLQHDIYPENWGLKATFPGVGTLYTQKSFGGSDTYTPISLRPDFVWETVDGRMVVLDAKFAMTSIGDLQIDDQLVPASKASSRDITKMHGYRDAIRGVNAALVMYPGTQGQFWNADGSSRAVSDLDEIIDAIVNCDLDGIGAVPLSPRFGGDV